MVMEQNINGLVVSGENPWADFLMREGETKPYTDRFSNGAEQEYFNGEPLIQGDPRTLEWGKGEWRDYGGGQKAAEFTAWRDFFELFGRNPTRSELSLVANNYISGDKNILNTAGGKASLSQYYQDQSNLPANRRERLSKESGKYSGDVNSIYQDLFKRGATDAEVKHFGTLLASGEIDPYELRSFIQATPEFQAQQDKAFRTEVGGELADLDTKAFSRQKEDVISRFARSGRNGSTALDFALTDLMGQIAEKRQGFLANLSADQYRGNKDTARADYGTVLNEMGANRDRAFGLQDKYRERGWNVSDYNRQQDDYMRALAGQNKGPGWMDYLNTALNGANTFANAGGRNGAGIWGR